MKKQTVFQKFNNIYIAIGFFFLTTALIAIIIPIWPYLWYRIHPEETNKETEKIIKEVVPPKVEIEEKKTESVRLDIPPLNTSLPEGKFVKIPKIEVNSPISTSKNSDEGLKNGTWIVKEYGTPEQPDLPIILAAHRFGYSSWSTEKRNRISYYNLPKTGDGDEITIYWNQREYKYKIYKSEESTYITDYTADLILYTCKFFNSPIRIFRYAQRIP
ncbi:TPA: sortase [Candidatus Dojkabacteria bacterium]|uniref:Sortase n=1 Tax=Candidatus Dojkabacteria bacterium TaxID=2099670 RepID=A0A832R8F5_9BACT|nr:sortase [Candidatus Dojkabacteria bacterium]